MLMDKEKAEQLREFIRNLAHKGNNEEFIQEVKELYTDDYRHPYSELFPVLLNIYKEDESLLDHITYQLQELIESQELDYEYRAKLEKLWDHISLEICRIRCWGPAYSVHKDLGALIEETDNAKEKLNDLQDYQKQMESHYITILSIFAAVVIGATSAISISGSVFECVVGASPIKLAIAGYLHVYLCSNIVFALAIAVLHNVIEDRFLKSIKTFAYLFNIIIPVIIVGLIWISIKFNI